MTPISENKTFIATLGTLGGVAGYLFWFLMFYKFGIPAIITFFVITTLGIASVVIITYTPAFDEPSS